MGATTAVIPRACARIPPIAQRPTSFRLRPPSLAKAGSSPRQRLTWWWQPFAMMPGTGFGMKVANTPNSFATCMQICRKVVQPVGRLDAGAEEEVHLDLAGVLVVGLDHVEPHLLAVAGDALEDRPHLLDVADVVRRAHVGRRASRSTR